MNRRALSWLVVPFFATALAGCDAEQTEEGDLPDVDVQSGDMPDVDVQGGNMPEYDVDAPDVDVQGGDMPEVDVQGGDMPDVDVDEPEAEGTEQPQGATGATGTNPPAAAPAE